MKYRAIGTKAQYGSVAELAYAADLKSAAARLVGSSPTAPTKQGLWVQAVFDFVGFGFEGTRTDEVEFRKENCPVGSF